MRIPSDTNGSALTVGAHPTVEPRLVRSGSGREDLDAYRSAGGYRTADRGDLIDAVSAAGLVGRGGAAFPTGTKMRAVRATAGRPVVVANGEEGEPTSMKDRWLMRVRPHLVLEGTLLAATAVGADRAYVYVSDAAAARSMRAAMAELDGVGMELRLVTVAPGYVAGEETAVVQAVEGGPAIPKDKPPRPFEAGVDGRPTLVSNVETLANLPFIATRGPARFRDAGTDSSPGTFLLSIGGNWARPGLYEVPLGLRLGDVVDDLGGTVDEPRGFLMGGYFAGLLNGRGLDIPLEYAALKDAGSGLGCGAVTVLGDRDCPVAVASDVLVYFDKESAGQCGSCFNGIPAMSSVLAALRDHAAEAADVDRLRHWSTSLRGRGACATLDGAANLAASLVREFPERVEQHLGSGCDLCEGQPVGYGYPPFAMPYADTTSGGE